MKHYATIKRFRNTLRLDSVAGMLLLAVSASAIPIDRDEAAAIAEEFLGKPMKELAMPMKVKGYDQVSNPVHILNAEDGQGFVIVAADDRVLPILGYSYSGVFDMEHAPEPALWLISEYQKAIESISESYDETSRMKPSRSIKRSAEVGPLLTTQWNQDAPYNEECPKIGDSHALTGCVATAMAQVINYENKNGSISSIPEYWTGDGIQLKELPPRNFDFGNLDGSEIAHLMRYCGQSVRMQYGLTESGAPAEDIPEALRTYFGWSPEVRLMDKSNYNEEHWTRIVTEEVEAGHPLIYSAVSESGAGHSFVVDGVSDSYFHVNWGWGGFADGYYSFTPFGSDNKAEYILMQRIVSTRDDDPSNDVITYGTTIDGINYQLNDDMTAAVLPLKNGNKYRGELVIPSSVQYEGKTYIVNYLGQNAFVNCKHLTSISIPATITGQDWSIYDGCENLHKVNVEDMASFIRLEVGGWWTGSPLTYGADLYLNGELVKDLVIPEGIESVGYCKFQKCTSIESVKFPSSMKFAGQYSFSDCPNLKKVDMLESSMETIDIFAFMNSISLQEVTIPATLKVIREAAFGNINGPGCGLRKVVCLAETPPNSENDQSAFSMKVLSDADLYVPDQSLEAYKKAKDWRSFVEIAPLSEQKPLPAVDTIMSGVVEYEINITEKYAKVLRVECDYWHPNDIEIPAQVEYNGEAYPVEVIGYEAFYAQRMNSLLMNGPIRRIGIRSFMGVTVPGEIRLANSLKRLPQRAFFGFSAKKMILHESIEYIGEEALYTEDYLEEIECEGTTPPDACENSFTDFQFANTVLSVPYGAKKAYVQAPIWANFKNVKNIGTDQEETFANDLSLSAELSGKTAVHNGMSLHVVGSVSNVGTQTAKGFILKYSIDDNQIGEKTFDILMAPKEKHDVDICVPVGKLDNGAHSLLITVVFDDGVIDEDAKDNTKVLNFESFDNGFYRVNLIEQFTSEMCGLTPSANPKVFKAIENTGNKDFVAHVFNHCGFYDDFLTVHRDYEWFYNEGGGTYTPAMMINRTDLNNSGYTPVMGVSDSAERMLISESEGLCHALVSVFTETNGDIFSVKAMLEKDKNYDSYSGFDYVTVVLIEDSIKAREQSDVWSDGYLTDYYHRNVLRKVLTSSWGEKISWSGDECLYEFQTELDPEWNVSNLYAVAFIHRYNPQSPVDCQVYTAGASYLPQYREKPDAGWYLWSAEGPVMMSIDKPEYTLLWGEEISLKPNITPENALVGTLSWTSSDEDVAMITSQDSPVATVRAVNEGVSTLTATAFNGVTVTCQVTVRKTTGISSMDTISATVSVEEGDIAIRNLEPGENVSIYSVDGKCIYNNTSDVSGTLRIGIGSKGIYLLHIGKHTHKLAL